MKKVLSIVLAAVLFMSLTSFVFGAATYKGSFEVNQYFGTTLKSTVVKVSNGYKITRGTHVLVVQPQLLTMDKDGYTLKGNDIYKNGKKFLTLEKKETAFISGSKLTSATHAIVKSNIEKFSFVITDGNFALAEKPYKAIKASKSPLVTKIGEAVSVQIVDENGVNFSGSSYLKFDTSKIKLSQVIKQGNKLVVTGKNEGLERIEFTYNNPASKSKLSTKMTTVIKSTTASTLRSISALGGSDYRQYTIRKDDSYYLDMHIYQKDRTSVLSAESINNLHVIDGKPYFVFDNRIMTLNDKNQMDDSMKLIANEFIPYENGLIYKSMTDNTLYAYNFETKSSKQVTGEMVGKFCALDDYIYYTVLGNHKVYKAKLDGKKVSYLMIDKSCVEFAVTNDRIYYVPINNSFLYMTKNQSLEAKGTYEDKMISNEARVKRLETDSKHIFYVGDDGFIYKMDAQTFKPSVFIQEKSLSYYLTNENLYYLNTDGMIIKKAL